MSSDIPSDHPEVLPPPVLWAQRKGLLYVKIALEDCSHPVIKLEKDKLYFRGIGGTEMKDHEITLDFFKEIKPDDSKYLVKGREVEFILIKADEGPYWKRLLKDDKKHHWLKVDFNKWRDEDDSDDDNDTDKNADFTEMMRQMGGLGGNSNTALDDRDGEPDSDDEDLPDLE
ncbi:prostaglandin E synthase 3-like [Limulus polyphemus]|uniref:Prostaglandin E synthase 3-like n=1 Tax=Limulus polyphemus TaxID=6850 RepID=A0ABM1B2G7_LIMPO|nr:prostaglandin E synthase 3-like [Limulus polyphemus]